MDELQEFDVSTFTLGESAVTVRIAGDLDLYAAPEVTEAFNALPSEQTSVLVDLTELTFVDSAGISALLAAERRLRGRGGSMVLLVDDLRVLRVLEVTGLDRYLAIHQDREEALLRLTGAAQLQTH